MVNVDRFLSKTTIDHSHPDCIIWTGARNRDGYGSYRFEGSAQLDHRASWKIFFGSISNKMNILHRCDNPPCVNPKHLFLGSQKDNVRDMYLKGRGNNVRSSKVRTSKLSNRDIKSIRKSYSAKEYTQQELANHYKVSQTMIGYIVRNIWWK